MKITKKLETEILELYKKYWNAYLNGKMRIMSSLMDENCKVIGSGKGEVFSNRKTAIKYYKSTADQVTGKAEMRNRKIKISPAGSQILISEENDFFVLMDSVWNFYGPGRISTLFTKSAGKWKIIHQHGFLPDTRTGGGEQINTDKIREENVRLKDAVKRRTIELENKSRELEIEASLERVRAVAMSMNKSEDLLSICEVSFKEFKKLGFDNLRNAIIHILNDDQKYFMDYDFSDYLGGSINKISYDSHPMLNEQMKKLKKANDAFAEVVIDGNQLESWKDFRRKGGQQDDPRLDDIPALYYYFYSIGVGDIGISTFEQIDESQIKSLKRFRNVFDLAYRRYTDIRQAEAQAREAEIELALERVRARTMGMQKSGELKEVIQVVYEQFVQLNIHIEHTGFIMDYKARDDLHIWLADQNEIPSEITIPCFDSLPNNSIREAKEKQQDFFAYLLTFEEKNKFYKDLFKFIPGVPEESLKYYFNCPGLAGSGVLLENVGLYIENFSGTPYTNEENNTLMRFGKVFQQTYTRFLDLQKAEAQARESQIQLALERVRARTMAMHKSEELSETSFVLFEQLKELDEVAEQISIIIYNEEEGVIELYATIYGNQWEEKGKIPYEKHFVHRNIYRAWKENKKSFVIDLTGKELDDFNKFKMEYSEQYKSEDELPKNRWVIHNAFFSKGALIFSTYEPRPSETIHLLERFAGVFEQTYTRFLDLKKAETQAREAQIEAALERVRSRTMAMQRSEELAETTGHLFEQLSQLGIRPYRCNIGIINQESDNCKIWSTTNNGDVIPTFTSLPLTETPSFNKIYNDWKNKQARLIFKLEGKERVVHTEYISQLGIFQEYMPDKIDLEKISKEAAIFSNFFFKQGFIFIHTLDELGETDLNIIQRFTNVFEQTYTRFLDLQKAEAQARESQIEAALERVRAVAMSMNKSGDLLSICEISFKEFKKLGFDNLRNTIIHMLNDEKEFFVDYDYSDHLGGSINNINYNSHPVVEDYLKQIKKADDAFAEVIIEGNQLDSWKDFRRIGGQRDDPKLDNIQTLYYYLYSIGVGDIGISTFKPINEDQLEIIKRFRNVFNLAYRRYNDITLAETQAREAQIETALERVRSRTMAMHKSDDLSLAVATVFTELDTLGLKTLRCGIGIFDSRNENKVEVWTTSSTEEDNLVQVSGDELLEGHPLLEGIYDAWQRQDNYSYVLVGKDIERYYNVVSKSNLKLPEQKIDAENLESVKQYYYCVMFPAGGLFAFKESEFSEENIQVMQRFADVFHLTFIRHLDLKQAEAQNKIILAENERKTKELEEARLLQLAMLPKELPQLPNLDIAVYMQTATEVGGDYYDFKVGYDGTLTTIIGDATGHGMKAGTVVTITKSLFNSMEMHENILGAFDKISQVIKGMKFRQLAMCLLMMKIKGNRLSISSAAMPPALIYRANNKKVEELLLKGMPLGTMSKFPYKKIEEHLNCGDTILLSSDGLPELANDKGDMFGYDRIKTEFQSIGEKEPEGIVEYLKNSASQWANGKEPDDDVTFVVIKVK